ncbi:MAG: CHASE2 domain-containing protein, partial [Burkholderiales bacterium]|nr:CHASE2 domain-containing protein [Burkholderiales bacterium]
MKTAIWKADWVVGLVVLLAFGAIGVGTTLLSSLESKAYDMGVVMTHRTPSDRVAIIAIDQTSIDNIGRWPWSRDIHAQFIDKLAAAKPKAIVSSVLFTEPQQDKGAAYIRQALDLYKQQHPDQGAVAAPTTPEGQPQVASDVPSPSDKLGALLQEASIKLDVDRQLADSMGRAGNVLLPMLLDPGEPQGNPDAATPAYVQRNEVEGAGSGNQSDGLPLPTNKLIAPIAAVGEKAAGIGHLVEVPDADGVVRQEPLVLRYYDQMYPSLSLLAAARSLNVQPKQIVTHLGSSVSVGGITIPTDAESRVYTYFYKDVDGKPAIPVDSFFDVASGKVPVEKYHDKVVLIGATASGVGSTFNTPIAPGMSPVVIMAHGVSSILQQDFFTAPGWAIWLKFALIVLVAAYLIALLPRLKAGPAAAVTGAIFVVLIGAHFGLMVGKLMWLQLMTPAALLVVGHLVLTTKRFLVTERGMEQSEMSAAESNRMLGLAFQGQGQLDMAFDKFRKVPMDDSMMDLL